jgi:hypothetical protein
MMDRLQIPPPLYRNAASTRKTKHRCLAQPTSFLWGCKLRGALAIVAEK